MKIKIIDDRGAKEREFEDGMTIEGVLKGEKASRQTVVTMLNGKVAHPKTTLKHGDELELVGVIYGG